MPTAAEKLTKYLDLVMMDPGSGSRITPEQFGQAVQEEIDAILARAERMAAQ